MYEKLMTYDMNKEQRTIIYGPGSVNNKNLALTKTTTLVDHEPTTFKVKGETSKIGKEESIEVGTEAINPNIDES